MPSTPPLGGASASWVQALGWVAGGGDTQDGQNRECVPKEWLRLGRGQLQEPKDGEERRRHLEKGGRAKE